MLQDEEEEELSLLDGMKVEDNMAKFRNLPKRKQLLREVADILWNEAHNQVEEEDER